MRYTLLVAALAATTAAATPAFAQQASATAEARGVVLSPLTLTKVTDLDFGTVAAGTATGTVSINPDTGIRTITVGANMPTLVPSSFSRARFDGLAQGATTVLLTLVPPTGNLLYSGANSIAVSNMSFDSAGPSRAVPAGGSFTAYVGADFTIAANQPNGTYSALFQVTAEYQ